jgi:hypothetical protein
MSPSRRNVASATPPNTLATWLPAGFVLLAGLAAYAAVASNAVANARLEFEEIGYLIKAWWYVTGALMPFSAADAAPTMPLFPYGLGALQTQIGLSATAARIAMVVLGLLNAVLLFSLCRKLTANSLASAAAVLLFIGTPATSYSFTVVSPVALVSLMHLIALWLLVLSVGRPKMWRSVVMGAVLAAIVLMNFDMALPVLFLIGLFMAAAGSARWVHGAVVIAVIAAIFGLLGFMLPDQFTAYLLNQPLVRDLMGLGTASSQFSIIRIAEDAFEGVLLPYGGTIMLCLLLFALTLRGPRVFWLVPIYFVFSIVALAVVHAPGCDVCLAMAPSQVTSVGALGAAMTLAFLARLARQQNLAGAPLIIGGVFLALALNTFAPVLATREALHTFPAEMLKQPRPGAEQDDIAALMRFIGQNVPAGAEPVLLMHRLPALPYAVHMAGRRFAAVGINPVASMRGLPATLSGARRESALAALERTGGWSAETLRRWIERDYDLVIWQDGAVAMDAMIAALLQTGFETAGTTEYRGAKLTLYKRKG